MDSLEMTKLEPATQTAPGRMPATCCPPGSQSPFPQGALRSWRGNHYVLALAGLAYS